MALQWAGGRLGQERVGIPPEQVRGEGERKGESVHAVGKLDGGNLHVYLGSRGLAAALKWKVRLETETQCEGAVMYLSVQTQIYDSKNIGLQVHQVRMHRRKYRRQFRLQTYSKKKNLMIFKK